MNPLRAAKRWAKKRYEEARSRTTSLSVVTSPKEQRKLNRAEMRALHKRAGVPLGRRTMRPRKSPTQWKGRQTLAQRWMEQDVLAYLAEQERESNAQAFTKMVFDELGVEQPA